MFKEVSHVWIAGEQVTNENGHTYTVTVVVDSSEIWFVRDSGAKFGERVLAHQPKMYQTEKGLRVSWQSGKYYAPELYSKSMYIVQLPTFIQNKIRHAYEISGMYDNDNIEEAMNERLWTWFEWIDENKESFDCLWEIEQIYMQVGKNIEQEGISGLSPNDKARMKIYDRTIKMLMDADDNGTWDEIYGDCGNNLDKAIELISESLKDLVKQYSEDNDTVSKIFYTDILKRIEVIGGIA